MEYMQNGSLEKMIYNAKMKKTIIPFKKKLKLLLDISYGMKYLHGLKPHALIHRDLKPANILIHSDGHAKVCDFGLSKIVPQSLSASFTTNIGSVYYMSPVSISLV